MKRRGAEWIRQRNREERKIKDDLQSNTESFSFSFTFTSLFNGFLYIPYIVEFHFIVRILMGLLVFLLFIFRIYCYFFIFIIAPRRFSDLLDSIPPRAKRINFWKKHYYFDKEWVILAILIEIGSALVGYGMITILFPSTHTNLKYCIFFFALIGIILYPLAVRRINQKFPV